MIILRTKDFSKKDYEGLSKRQQKVLKRLRDGKAKELRDNRKAFETIQKMDKGTTGTGMAIKKRNNRQIQVEGQY